MYIHKNFLTLFLLLFLFISVGCSKSNSQAQKNTANSDVTPNEATTEATTETTTEDPRPLWEREDWSSVDNKEKVSILNPNWELVEETDDFDNPTGKFKLVCKNIISNDEGTDTTLTIYMDAFPHISIGGNNTIVKYVDTYNSIENDPSKKSMWPYIHLNVPDKNDKPVEIATNIVTDYSPQFNNDDYANICEYLKKNNNVSKIYLQMENYNADAIRVLEDKREVLKKELGQYDIDLLTYSAGTANVNLTLDCTNFDKIFNIWLETIYG